MAADTAFEVGRLYAPLKAISDVLTASQKDLFVGLPGIQGYYPMSITGATGTSVNHTGGGGPLTQTGVVPVGYDGNSYRHLGNGTNFLAGSGLYGITGTETFISSALRGLTVGGWFMVDTTPAAIAGVISKDGAAAQRGYVLAWTSADVVRFGVSLSGGSIVQVNSPAAAISQWHFLAGRYIPSTEIAVFVDGDKTVNTTAIPSSIFVSSQAFEIGRHFNDNARVLHAKTRDVFICAAALSDEILEELRQSSAPNT